MLIVHLPYISVILSYLRPSLTKRILCRSCGYMSLWLAIWATGQGSEGQSHASSTTTPTWTDHHFHVSLDLRYRLWFIFWIIKVHCAFFITLPPVSKLWSQLLTFPKTECGCLIENWKRSRTQSSHPVQCTCECTCSGVGACTRWPSECSAEEHYNNNFGPI